MLYGEGVNYNSSNFPNVSKSRQRGTRRYMQRDYHSGVRRERHKALERILT